MKKLKREFKIIEQQVTTEVQKITNDHDNNVHNIKDLLSRLGINHENREEFDIGMPHPLNPLDQQEPIQYRWIASTSLAGDSNQEKGEQAKLVLKAVIETKRGNDVNDVTSEFKAHFSKLNLDGIVAYMTTATKLGIYTYGSASTALNELPKGYYPAKWHNVTTEELFTKYNINYTPFWSKISPNNDLIKEIDNFCQQEKFSSNQSELVAETFREGLYCKLVNDVTNEFKNLFPKLNPSGVAALMHILNTKSINIDGAIANALPENYPATWENTSTKEFFTKYEIKNPYYSFEDKIEVIPNLLSEIQKEANTLENKAEYTNTLSKSLNIDGNEELDSDIEIITLLKEKVTLTNSKEVEVKKIIGAIYKPKELQYYLDKLTPKDSELVKKEIALKLAYDLYQNIKEFDEVSNIADKVNVEDLFDSYTNLDLRSLKDEEVNITGGEVSYLGE